MTSQQEYRITESAVKNYEECLRFLISFGQYRDCNILTIDVCSREIEDIRSRPIPASDAPPHLDRDIVYYPMSEGELRDILDMKHIPEGATNDDIFRENTKILAILLNRDPINPAAIAAAAVAEERGKSGGCPYWNKAGGDFCKTALTITKAHDARVRADERGRILNKAWSLICDEKNTEHCIYWQDIWKIFESLRGERK